MTRVLLHRAGTFTSRHENGEAILSSREERKTRSSVSATFLSQLSSSTTVLTVLLLQTSLSFDWLSDVTSINHPLQGCGFACRTVMYPLEVGLSTCFDVWFDCCLKDVISPVSPVLKSKSIRKGQRGQFFLGEIILNPDLINTAPPLLW